MQDCRYICLTPTKNEGWIIRHFLAAAKLWANNIIVADQLSSDGTREILQRTPEVETVLNNSENFDENHRQKLLLDQARTISGKRILVGLDADEALSSNCIDSKEWDLIANAQPGTILRFRWVNVLPGFTEAWIPPHYSAFGFVDDGSNHNGRRIHSPRVPQPEGAPVLDLEEIVVLHFQYVLWERMESKQRWYQAWEHAKHSKKGALDIFREYNHMFGSWENDEIKPIKPEWIEGYERAGVDFKTLKAEAVTWWDREILEMLSEHGPEHFRKIAIWDKDWNSVSTKLGAVGKGFSDPRSFFEKAAHKLLKISQKRRSSVDVRTLEAFLRRCGW